jgi:malate/lactate dehydrogenase
MGYDPDSFWEQTPRTLAIASDAYRDTQIEAHNNRAWQAWHVAALGRGKKMVPLSKLQITEQQVRQHYPKQMQDQIDGLINWVRATGGKVIYSG